MEKSKGCGIGRRTGEEGNQLKKTHMGMSKPGKGVSLKGPEGSR
jgi:hypothetical protein